MKSHSFVFMTISILSLGSNFGSSYEGYKLYQVEFQTDENWYKFNDEWSGQDPLDIWHVYAPDKKMSVFISPRDNEYFLNYWRNKDIMPMLLDDKIGMKIANEQKVHNQSRRKRREVERIPDFTHFWDYDDLLIYLDHLQSKHSDKIQVMDIGTSIEKRPIKGVTVSLNGTVTGDKPIVFVNALIHAREWLSMLSTMYLIHQLVEETDKNLEILEDVDWVIIPVSNVDGFIYTHNHSRLWRNNRNLENICYETAGVDLNRNFDYLWSWKDPARFWNCPGATKMSEPEVKAISNFLKKYLKHVKVFLDMHTAGPYVLYPFGNGELLNNWKEHQKLGEKAREEALKYIEPIPNGEMKVGNVGKTIYRVGGTFIDYACGRLNVPFCYALEVFGAKEVDGDWFSRFSLPIELLPNATQATFQMFKVFGAKAAELGNEISEEIESYMDSNQIYNRPIPSKASRLTGIF